MRPEYQPYQSINPNFYPPFPACPRDNSTPPELTVCFGQRTFDAEGSEQPGRYFSRQIHWPGGASGVTIGRGYDMGQRTRLQVQKELTYAGLDSASSEMLSLAAGLRGAAAERFVTEYQGYAPTLPLEVQQSLFEEITTPEVVADIKRILSKSDVVSRYGTASWEELPPPVQELLFDLRYRGDYRPATRADLQPLIVARDYKGLSDLMNDFSYWRELGVPEQRIRERISILSSD